MQCFGGTGAYKMEQMFVDILMCQTSLAVVEAT